MRPTHIEEFASLSLRIRTLISSRKSLTDKAIFELLLNDQWELAKVRSKQDISGLRRSWAFLGAVKLSASPGQERQLNKWLKMNLEKATGNLKGSWDPTGEFGLNF